MANNSTLFSFAVPMQTVEAEAWAKKTLANPPKTLLSDWLEPEDSFLEFEYEFGKDAGGSQLYIWSDGEGNIETVIDFLKLFLQQDLNDLTEIGFGTAFICDKPRAGEFGGAAYIVRGGKNDVESLDTFSWLDKKLNQ